MEEAPEYDEFTPHEDYNRRSTIMSAHRSFRKLNVAVEEDVYDYSDRPTPEEEFFRLAVLQIKMRY